VWAALTDPAQLREWSPYTADRNLGTVGDRSEELAGSVTYAERATLLEYTLGTDLVRWELSATDAGTRLTLRHTVEDRDWVPKVAAGWHICLVVAQHLLDGHPIGPIVGENARNYGWDALHDAYAEELRIAGTGWPADLRSRR
jgi:uncharacterized protein YndB with AHSA1/START domain